MFPRTIMHRVAMVASAFTLAVAAGLWLHAGVGSHDDPLNTKALVAMKAQLKRQPDDEVLRSAIRDADVVLRTDFFTRQRTVRWGAWLLLIGTAVTVAAAKLAQVDVRGAHLPAPPKRGVYVRMMWAARWGVVSIGVVMFGGAALLLVQTDGAKAWPALAEAQGQSPVISTVSQIPSATREQIAANWPAFRGPGAMGVAMDRKPPLTWDGPRGVNIAWQVAIDMPGHSSPVVWEDRIFVTAATDGQREVRCYALADGQLLWTHEVALADSMRADPPEVMHDTGFAAPTPATDGHRVYAIFANGDLVAVDLEGQRIWAHALGTPANMYGHSTSLICHGDRVIVQLDQTADQGQSTLTAYDGPTGEVVWRVTPDTGASWASPCIGSTSTGEQLITVANRWAVAYHPDTGEALWRVGDFRGDIASSPVIVNDMAILIMPGYRLIAMRTDGRGDVEATHTLWRSRRDVPDVTSPVADDQQLYALTSHGILTAFRLSDGEMVWHKYVGDESFRASPTLVNDRLYLFDDVGNGFVLNPIDGEQVGGGPVGQPVAASPAFVGHRIIVRTEQGLVCIAGGAP